MKLFQITSIKIILLTSICFSCSMNTIFKLEKNPNPTLNNTCTISGFVLDRKTKEPLIGANVILIGTSKGAATYKDGSFSINNVPPGKIRNKSQRYRV